jgi:hypothetical protein
VQTHRAIPGPDASELDWLLFEQDGVLTSAQAVRLIGQGRLRGKLAGKQWRRLCRGVVVTHNGPLTYSQTLWAAVLVVGEGAVLGGFTAAHEAGLRLGEHGPIHLLVPDSIDTTTCGGGCRSTCLRCSSTGLATCRKPISNSPARRGRQFLGLWLTRRSGRVATSLPAR